jgi:hypothetical protein
MAMERGARGQVRRKAGFGGAESSAGDRLLGLAAGNPLGQEFAYLIQRRMSSRSEAP